MIIIMIVAVVRVANIAVIMIMVQDHARATRIPTTTDNLNIIMHININTILRNLIVSVRH